MDHLHVGGEQVRDTVAGDRVRVAPTELHEIVAAGRFGFARDCTGYPPRERAVAELVDVLHDVASANKASVRSASLASRRVSA
jgi:hypothetical protein